MSRYSVINIANRFLVFHGGYYPLNQGKLQKLVYFTYRKRFSWPRPPLSSFQGKSALFRRVWAKYERYDPIDLTRFIQQPGTPWSNTYFREEGPRIISEEEMRIYFERLAIAGRYSERVFGPSL